MSFWVRFRVRAPPWSRENPRTVQGELCHLPLKTELGRITKQRYVGGIKCSFGILRYVHVFARILYWRERVDKWMKYVFGSYGGSYAHIGQMHDCVYNV